MTPPRPSTGRHVRRRSYTAADDLAVLFDLVVFAIWVFVICASLAARGTP